MRYYKITLQPVDSSHASVASSGDALTGAKRSLSFTTHPNGLQAAPDMGAMHVLFDLPVTAFDAPQASFYVEIRGVDIATISQASDLQGWQVKIYGGMGKGYPLAKPDQAGLLVVGSVFQAFGNWQDTNMSLNLLVQPFTKPLNETNYPKLTWHWQKGQKITDAISQTFKAALPDYGLDFTAVGNNLTAGSDDIGFYGDIPSLAQVISSVSTAANPDTSYQGVKFYLRNKTFYFYDNGTSRDPKKIEFEDMIGQPTWIGPGRVMMQTVMRADINMNDVITMPAFNQNGSNQTLAGYGTIAATQASGIIPKRKSLFQGNFTVTGIRHIGDSRNPDGAAWVTVFNLVQP